VTIIIRGLKSLYYITRGYLAGAAVVATPGPPVLTDSSSLPVLADSSSLPRLESAT
jgi:hypothetical protein